MKDDIRSFIGALVDGDDSLATASLNAAILSAAQTNLGLPTAPPQNVNESMVVKMLQEMFNDTESPIKFKGDKVFVEGKHIGFIRTDYSDTNGGIDFISVDGSESKEFDDVEHLFRFLSERFTKNGGKEQ
jgi:hypothetical protein